MQQYVCRRGMSTRMFDAIGNLTFHRCYAWPPRVSRLHPPAVRFQLPQYLRRHIQASQRARSCHGATRLCPLSVPRRLVIPFQFNLILVGWPHVEFCVIFGAPAAWSSLTVWWYQHFIAPICDVIDTLVEMELVIGCLVDLVTWFSLMEYCTRGIGWGSCSNLVM